MGGLGHLTPISDRIEFSVENEKRRILSRYKG